jgi:hypothetical protein
MKGKVAYLSFAPKIVGIVKVFPWKNDSKVALLVIFARFVPLLDPSMNPFATPDCDERYTAGKPRVC